MTPEQYYVELKVERERSTCANCGEPLEGSGTAFCHRRSLKCRIEWWRKREQANRWPLTQIERRNLAITELIDAGYWPISEELVAEQMAR